MAFVLGAVFELDGAEAAEILEIEPSAYRKRLARARAHARVYGAQMRPGRRAGLVPLPLADPPQHRGRLDGPRATGVRPPPEPGALTARGFPGPTRRSTRGERYLAVPRSHRDYAAPETVRAGLQRQLAALE